MPVDRRLAAIMFTDIVGYTSIMGESEKNAFKTININREIHQHLVKEYHGKIVKELGDGLLIVFENGTEAVQCAIKIQQEAGNDKIPLRIGIHEGEVVFEDGDVFGDGINIASRIQTEATSGGVCISDTMYRIIRNKEEFKTQSIGKKYLRNVKEQIQLYQLKAEGLNTEIQNKKFSINWWVTGISILFGIGIGIGLSNIFINNKYTNQDKIELQKSIRPFTGIGGLTSSPSWSPDGQWITYSSNVLGNMDIWKKKLTGGEALRLTISKFNESEPAWSPNGQYIAYTSDDNGVGISVISSAGGTPISISSFGSCPFWSPDSKYFGFEWQDGLYITEFKGGSVPFCLVKGITAKPYASWTPNGNDIVFYDRTHKKIQKVSLTDSLISTIYIIPSGEEISGLSFSADGRKILISKGAFGGTKDIFEVDIDPESIAFLNEPKPISITTTDDIDVAISPFGGDVAYTSRSIERHLWRFPINIQTGNIMETGEKITDTGKLNYYPSITTDGINLIWTSHRSGIGQLYFKNMTNKETHKVTTDWGRNIREIFGCFGDNSQIYYSSTIGGSFQLWQVYSVGSIGLNITAPINPTFDSGPIITNDGKNIIFYSNRSDNFDIWSVNIDGSQLKQITNWPSSEIYPVLKPNEKIIAFISDQNGNFDIWGINLEDMKPFCIIDDKSMEGWCAWSPDGKWFYYVSNKNGRYNIWKMSSESGAKKQMTNYSDLDYGLPTEVLYTKFSVSENSIVLPLERRTGDIYILSL